MADKGLPVAEATAGTLDLIDTKTVTNGISQTVQRQIIAIGEDLTTPIANPLPVQLGDGTNSQSIKGASTESAFTDVAAVSTLRPSENHIGAVGGNTVIITPTLAVTAAAYTAGYCVGGLMTLTSAMRISGGTGVLQSITLTDHAGQGAALQVFIFASSPTGTFTDHAAFPTLAATELAKIVAMVTVPIAAYAKIGTQSIASFSVGEVVAASGSANLYMAIATTGTPTYAATSDLNINVGFLRD